MHYLKTFKWFYYCHESTGRTAKQNKLLRMLNTNLSDLLKIGLAGITLISEEHLWQFFLHIALRCLANHKKLYVYGYTEEMQLWDFDKKSEYFFILLSIHLNICHDKESLLKTNRTLSIPRATSYHFDTYLQ